MISTINHRLRQQSLALESFLEAHREVVSPGLGGSAVLGLLASLRQDRRRLKAADRRVALRLHEAAVARHQRWLAVAEVRRRMIRLRALAECTYGPRGARYLLCLRSALSRHPATLDGQARRAVHALRVREVEGVRLRLPCWEVSPALLAEGLEPWQRELAATVTAGFQTAERLFAAQADRGILHKEVSARLRAVRDAVWRACHQVRQPRLAARVRRMLMRRRRTVVRRPLSECEGRKRLSGALAPACGSSRELPGSLARGADAPESAQERRHRNFGRIAASRSVGPGLRGSFAAPGSSDTACEADFSRKIASTPAGRRVWRRNGASAPRVRPSGHFFAEGHSLRGPERVSGRFRSWGRGPPAPRASLIRSRRAWTSAAEPSGP